MSHHLTSLERYKNTYGKEITGTCEKCGEPSHHIHHIDENPKNNKVDNLQELCTFCHCEIHDISPRQNELRRLVVLYEAVQKDRIILGNRIKALERIGEIPTPMMIGRLDSAVAEEKQLKEEIKLYLEGREKGKRKNPDNYPFPVYEWLTAIKGVDAVLAGKLIARIDLDYTPSAAALRQYAGYGDPTLIQARNGKKMSKEEAKKLGNRQLKKDLFLVTECWVKLKRLRREHKYVQMIRDRKAYELRRMLNAKRGDEEIKPKRGVEAPVATRGHADNRARRYTIKKFLNDLYAEMIRLSEDHGSTEHHFAGVESEPELELQD